MLKIAEIYITLAKQVFKKSFIKWGKKGETLQNTNWFLHQVPFLSLDTSFYKKNYVSFRLELKKIDF